jgi:F-box interacting protein
MVYIPTELLVEILLRLPWTSRRRLRLVCRAWRDLVHQRTTEMQQCRDAVPLVVTTETMYLLYDLDTYYASKPRELWSIDAALKFRHMEVVGVCNGVLCLCDDAKSGGAITLVNPATGDSLALPPIPRAGLFRRHNTRGSGTSWHQAYGLGYHHATGQYKVVHVPCFFKTKETLQVFTLGEASWREISTPSSSKCKLQTGIVSVNGATYWVTRSDGIMSFDLESEQVTCVKPLPALARARPICYLGEVQRRLSIVIATPDEGCRQTYGRGYERIEVFTSTIYFSLYKFIV